MAANNRRQFPRQRRRLRLVVNGDLAFTGDVAAGGFCAELMRVVQPGARVMGTITLAGHDFEYVGQVCWARAGDPRIRLTGRMGVRFCRDSARVRGRVPTEVIGALKPRHTA